MIYHGHGALKKIEELENCSLGPEECRVVLVEGYSDKVYRDTKGIPTKGVGQTGPWLNKTFRESFEHHEDRVIKRIPSYPSFPTYLRAELMQAEYRGDLGLSPKAVGLLNDERYIAAAEEFLNNREYKNPRTPKSIKKRLEAVHHALHLYAKQQG